VTRVRRCHHVLRIKHLLSELRNRDSSVSHRASSSKWRKSDHEEVKTGEGNHVDRELSEIRVELTGESEAGGDTGHDEGDEVVQVAVGGGRQLERSEADVVESLVVDAEGLVRVLHELVHGECRVVWLDDGVGDLKDQRKACEKI